MTKKKNRNLTKVKNLTDLIPKWANEAFSLPTGKPLYRSVFANGPARVITYIFKNGDVYKHITFRGLSKLYLLNPVFVTDNGDFIKG